MTDADQEGPAGLNEGKNEELLLPIDGVSPLSFAPYQRTIQNRYHLQEQDGACWLLTRASPKDEKDAQPEQGQAEKVASGEDNKDLPLNRKHFEIIPNPDEKIWIIRKR
jgi:hypothetical protein